MIKPVTAQDDDKDHQNKQELLVKVLVPAAVLIFLAGSIMCCYLSRVLKAKGDDCYELLRAFSHSIL